MKREVAIAALEAERLWDLVVIGGGATGLGAAVDAASRGHRTVLVEQADFAQGTSSRSTKLVHGGVRYLKQGNLSLVLEALRERGLLRANAPHLVHDLAFVIPVYRWWEGPFYGVGMKLYDRLAGKLGLARSEILSREETLRRIPTLEPEGLEGGVSYHDAQFDDARLAIHLAHTVFDHGGFAANHVRVVRLIREDGRIRGVVAQDAETGREIEVRARCVINATGVYADAVRRLDEPAAAPSLVASQGTHLVLPREFLPGASAIMIPRTADGRVLFALPWHDRVIVGTTDTPVDRIDLEPRPLEQEIEFLMTHAAKYLTWDPVPSDVLSVFSGLRPLVHSGARRSTAALSRGHSILVSDSGLVTILGGKWTTYRKMAQDVVDRAEVVAGLERRACRTEDLRVHGYAASDGGEPLGVYGADAEGVRALGREDSELGRPIEPGLSYTRAQVVWAAREEMARTVEDVLSRRLRALLLDARRSIGAAPRVAGILARELGRDAAWENRQVTAFRDLARGYLLDG